MDRRYDGPIPTIRPSTNTIPTGAQPPSTVGGDQEDTLTAHSCIHALGLGHALHYRARLVLCAF